MTILNYQLSPLMALLLGAAVLVLLIFTSGLFGPSKSKRLQRRLRQVTGKQSRLVKEKDQNLSAVNIDMDRRDQSLLDRGLLQFLPRASLLQLRLQRTGRNISISKYFIINILFLGIATLIFKGMFGFSWPLAGCMGVVFGLGIPHKYIGRLINKRHKAFITQFPEAIDLIVRGARSGLPISECVKTIASEIPEPVGTEFKRITDGMKIGQTMEEALWECSNRLDIAEMKFFVIALSIQRETGGNLAETLENLSGLLRKRKQVQLKIKAMSAEAKASAMVIGSLPFLVFGALYKLNDKYVGVLLHDPRGQVLLGVGLILMALGHFLMSKMVQFKI